MVQIKLRTKAELDRAIPTIVLQPQKSFFPEEMEDVKV